MRLVLKFYNCLILMILVSCSGSSKIDIEVYNQSTINSARITNVQVEGHQLHLSGVDLDSVTKITVEGPNGFNESFKVESNNKSELFARSFKDINFPVGSLFNFILSDAHGSATFLVDFTLQDASVTNLKLAEQSVTGSKIHHMGASDGDALVYNNGTGQWEARALNGLSLKGSWNANTNSPSLASGGANTSPFSGDYYLVSDAGSTLIDGINVWNVGDWVIFNGSTWDYISNSSGMVSFNGRQGMVVPAANDYTWNEIDKTTSDINDIANVDTTGVAAGKILKFDGAKWAIADDDSAGGPGSVTTTEILDGTISNDDLAGSIAQAKITNLTTDLAARLKIDGSVAMTGALDMGAQAITNVGNVDGVDISALNTTVATNTTAIAAKLALAGGTMTGNISFSAAQTVDGVDVSALNTTVGTNTAAIATNATGITARLPLAGGTMTGNITFSGAETVDGVDVSALNTTVGTNTTNIANNTTAIGTKLPLDGSAPMTGALDLGNNKLKLKSDNTNYVELISPNTLAATYTLTFPGNDGTSGQLLSTNGSGILSWINAGGIGDFKADGTVAMTGALDMGAQAITNVGNVDGVDVSALNTTVGTNTTDIAARLPIAGGNMTGNITFSAAQTVDGVDVSALNTTVGTNTTNIATNVTNIATNVTNIATNVTDIAARLPLAGGTMTGNIVFSAAQTVDGVDVSVLNTTVGSNTTAIGTKIPLDGSVPMTGALDLGNNKLKLKSDNANYVELISPNTLAATYTLTFPGDDGAAGQLLSTNGTGILSWVAAGGTGDFKADGTVAMTADLDLGNNKLKYKSDNANFVEMIAPASLGATYTLTLPADDGTVGQVLSTNGTGTLAWASGSTGTVTSVTAGTGLTGGPITTTGTLNVDVGIGANQIVQLDGAAKLPAIDGSQLTNLINPTSATVLTGFVTGADSTVLNTDTVEVAFEKLQGQVDGNNTDIAALPSLGTASGDAIDIGSVPNCSATQKLQMSLGPVFTVSCVTTDKNSVSLGNLDNIQQMPLGYLDTDVNLAADSDVKVPSQKAIKAYVDAISTSGDFSNGGDTATAGRTIGNNDAFDFNVETTGANRLTVKADGKIGIGTTTPLIPLQTNSGTHGSAWVDVVPEIFAVTSADSRIAFVSDDTGLWGSILTLKEIDDATNAFQNSWSIARKTTSANGSLHFKYGTSATSDTNSTKFFMGTDGDVGIGTETPGAKLEVAGQVKITGGVPGVGKVLTSDAVGLATWEVASTADFSNGGDTATAGRTIGNNDAFDLNIETTGTNRLTVKADGKIGVGTTAPASMFDIKTAGTIPLDIKNVSDESMMTVAVDGSLDFVARSNIGGEMLYVDMATATASGDFAYFKANRGLNYNFKLENTHTGGSLSSHYRIANADATIAFDYVSSDNGRLGFTGEGTEHMSMLTSTGYIGIGTITPSTELEVAGQVKITGGVPGAGKILTSDAAGLATWEVPGASEFTDGGEIGGGNRTLGNTDSFDLGFKTNNTTKMTIKSDGKVGIGTAVPSDLLHVSGGDIRIETGNEFSIYNAGAQAGGIKGAGTYDVHPHSRGALRLYTNTDGVGANKFEIYNSVAEGTTTNPSFTIIDSGDVGIGTTTPTKKLEVNGDAKINGELITKANDAVAATAINFDTGNIQYTSADCGALSIEGLDDGTSYTLVIQGTTSGTCAFSAINSNSTDTVKLPPGHGATVAGKHTIYTFIKAGTFIYTAYISGY